MKKVLTVERERLTKLSEVGESNIFFFKDEVSCEKDLLRWKDMSDEDLRGSLANSREVLENIPEGDWTRENLEKSLMEACEKHYKNEDGKIDRGKLLWPLRAALTCEQKSPSPFEVAWVLGKTESLKRIAIAMEKIK